jgi:hypothetical protein
MERIEEIEKAEEEIRIPSNEEAIKGYRILILDGYGEVRLSRPTQFVVDSADRMLAGLRFKMLKDKDIPTEHELKVLYKERVEWTPELEEEMNKLSTRVLMLAKEIRDSKLGYNTLTRGVWVETDEEANQLLGKLDVLSTDTDTYTETYAAYKALRLKCLKEAQVRYEELRTVYNELFSSTIESFMNYERQLFYCTRCYKLNDKYIWDSVEAFKEDNVFFVALQEAVRFWSELGSEESSYFFDVLQGVQISD